MPINRANGWHRQILQRAHEPPRPCDERSDLRRIHLGTFLEIRACAEDARSCAAEDDRARIAVKTDGLHSLDQQGDEVDTGKNLGVPKYDT